MGGAEVSSARELMGSIDGAVIMGAASVGSDPVPPAPPSMIMVVDAAEVAVVVGLRVCPDVCIGDSTVFDVLPDGATDWMLWPSEAPPPPPDPEISLAFGHKSTTPVPDRNASKTFLSLLDKSALAHAEFNSVERVLSDDEHALEQGAPCAKSVALQPAIDRV
jgi:hypothetical protein